MWWSVDFAILDVSVDFITFVVFGHLVRACIFRKEMQKIRATFYCWRTNGHRCFKESRWDWKIFWATVKEKRVECLLVLQLHFFLHLKKPLLLIKYLKIRWVVSFHESYLCKSSTSKWRNYNKTRSQGIEKINRKVNRCFPSYWYRCLFWHCISLLIISMQFIETGYV